MRWVSTRVLPEPAPATMSSGLPSWRTASRCCGLSPASRASGSMCGNAPVCRECPVGTTRTVGSRLGPRGHARGVDEGGVGAVPGGGVHMGIVPVLARGVVEEAEAVEEGAHVTDQPTWPGCARRDGRRGGPAASEVGTRRHTVGSMASAKGGFGDPVELEVGDKVVRLSSPGRVYFPARGETKLDLARYYLSVGDGIVGALRERPCMLHRFPKGMAGDKVHQKRLPRGAPPWMETVRVHFPRYGQHADELCVTELAHVVWAVQM